MSTRILVAAVAAATLAIGLEPGTALASKAYYVLTGQVTAPPVGRQIAVNGQTYPIASGSQAATEVNEVVEGENVQLTFNAPVGSSSAQVVAIHELSGS